MRIRAATQDDIPALAGLLSILFAQEAEFQPDRDTQIRGLTQIIENPDIGMILVAEQDDALVGMVNLLFTVSTALGGRVAVLEDMVVCSDARGSGLGTRLLKEAISFAKSRGCKRITLLTDHDNLAAQEFYRRNGFVSSGMIPLRLLID